MEGGIGRVGKGGWPGVGEDGVTGGGSEFGCAGGCGTGPSEVPPVLKKICGIFESAIFNPIFPPCL